jgi:hypothetical protein
MRRVDYRILIGGGLILMGGLIFLERLGLFRGLLDLFWGAVMLVAAAYFLYRFALDPRGEWWAAIPGFALAGLATESLMSPFFGDWDGLFFLGALGLGFFAVYLSGRQRWWAIIPGGVLITLAFISVLSDWLGVEDTGGFLFVGFGLTFLVVAVLASMQWAYIPGVILLVLGAILGIANASSVDLLWPAALYQPLQSPAPAAQCQAQADTLAFVPGRCRITPDLQCEGAWAARSSETLTASIRPPADQDSEASLRPCRLRSTDHA